MPLSRTRYRGEARPSTLDISALKWPNVEIAREQLNARLPENVTRHELRNVGHYFDGRSRAGIVLSSGYAYRQGVALFRKIKDLGAGT